MRRRPEDGFTLVEVVVAIALITVVLTSMSVFYVRSLALGEHWAGREDAVRVATTGLEEAAALGTEVLTGRSRAAVDAQERVPGVEQYLEGGEQAADKNAAAGAKAKLVTTGEAVTLNGITYTKHWYVQWCWRSAAASGTCAVGNAGRPDAVAFLRVVVAVRWADRECANRLCAYFLATLVGTGADPIFPLPPTTAVTSSPTPSASPSPSSASPSPSPSVSPSPSPSATATAPAAIWANRTATDTNPAALWLASANLTVTGVVHTNAGLYVAGTGIVISPRVEYVTSQYVSGGTVPTPVRVSAGAPTGLKVVADYAPGGTAATAAGTGYHAVPSSACAGGTWTYGSVPATATVVYVPCAVNVTTTTVTPLLVATGAITVALSSVTIGGGLLSASTANPAINISGSYARVNGRIQALGGGVQLLGSYGVFQCGVIGDTVQVRGSDITISADSTCR
ncbi:prepilin-type N-terminal cleavage/methylation domain-containing protein [Actinoplanes sp. NPDC024001]|uniref:type IV pilus modification PilV family protein n=1 Tax=Actinoplanes sp. NPDC024001 TaxID=3154598 RepID=UPI0033FFB891